MHRLDHVSTTQPTRWIIPALALVSVGLIAEHADAANYRTCIKRELMTVDSGRAIPKGPNAGDTEDRYAGADSGILASAVGVRVKVWRDDWSAEGVYDAEPTTGCFNWSDSWGGDYNLQVYDYQTDVNGNMVRQYSSLYEECTNYPGLTYYNMVTDFDPSASGTDIVSVGDYTPSTAAMSMAGYTWYRYHDGLHNKRVHLKDHTYNGNWCYSSAHYSDSNHYITSGRHCVKMANCSENSNAAQKFAVAHEMGHVITALHYGDQSYGSNGNEPGADSGWNGDVSWGTCEGGSGYNELTLEWSSIGFREGFAHFIAAKVFNDKDTEGMFVYADRPHDLERWDQGGGTGSGGRHQNKCCADPGDCADFGTGTNIDWLLFLWDWYTNVSNTCPSQPAQHDMLELYSRTRNEGGLARSNYYGKLLDAAEHVTVPACLAEDRLPEYGVWNGVNH